MRRKERKKEGGRRGRRREEGEEEGERKKERGRRRRGRREGRTHTRGKGSLVAFLYSNDDRQSLLVGEEESRGSRFLITVGQ